MRRPPKRTSEGDVIDPMDQDGLSVFDSFHIDQQACIEENLSCFGLATLHVGTLLDLGLTVIRDPEDFRKLLIADIPFENPADAAQEALLDAVAATARIAVRCKWKKPS